MMRRAGPQDRVARPSVRLGAQSVAFIIRVDVPFDAKVHAALTCALPVTCPLPDLLPVPYLAPGSGGWPARGPAEGDEWPGTGGCRAVALAVAGRYLPEGERV